MAKDMAARMDGPIVRCVKLIRLLSEVSTDISIKDAAKHLDLPASTTHRLLRVLMQEGLVAKNPSTLRYRAGLDLERIGGLLAFRKGYRDLVMPFLQRVVEQCGEACMFVGYLPTTYQVSLLAAINSRNPLRYEMELYVPHSVAWGATGRSVFAFLPEEEQRLIADSASPSPVTGQTLPPWDQLKPELDAIKARGYALTHGQKLKGAVGIGAPVHNAAGKVIGSLCVTVPEIRFDPATETSIAQLLLAQAQEFDASVGLTFPA